MIVTRWLNSRQVNASDITNARYNTRLVIYHRLCSAAPRIPVLLSRGKRLCTLLRSSAGDEDNSAAARESCGNLRQGRCRGEEAEGLNQRRTGCWRVCLTVAVRLGCRRALYRTLRLLELGESIHTKDMVGPGAVS